MSIQEELKDEVKNILGDETYCVIGWGKGPDPLQHAPLFINDAQDVENLDVGFLSVQNTALYIPEYKGKKIAVIVKGCDSRSIGQQTAEGLIKREDVTVIGFPCKGVIDHAKLAKLLEEKHGKIEAGLVTSVTDKGTSLTVTFPTFEETIEKSLIQADKCFRCQYPNAVNADIFIGEKSEPIAEKDSYNDLEDLEKMSLEQRTAFWEKEMSRCIRCYACRNACPLCVCRDHCIASSREPEWVTQTDSVKEKLFFQVIHATHLAGRCTGCGECERACPVGIPVLLLKRSMSRKVEALFGYQAGVDEQATPPLMSFEIEEHRIKERDW